MKLFLLFLLSLPLQNTLRVDYIFSGNDKTCDIAVADFSTFAGWAGKTHHLDEVPLRGNGQISMSDSNTGEVLYRNSFSTLFQEWQATEEATKTRKSFENVFLLPMPDSPVNITVELYDFHGKVSSSLTHPLDPEDILIKAIGQNPIETKDIYRSGPADKCIDVVIVAEGYTAQEMDIFYQDAQIAFESFMEHKAFREMKEHFNFIAVPLVSKESGVSIPKKKIWKDTALGSNFDTFYSDRYLTTGNLRSLHDQLAGLEYEHIIILANTDNYGGGGIYNSYTLTTAHHRDFRPVVVHEFGHSFAGLADEYYYDDQFVEYYYPDIEPWEQNITTMKDFESKWKDMLGKDGVDLYEGGGYQSKGVWRGSKNCRMHTNNEKDFCPVCTKAIIELIRFYTEE